MSQLQITPSIQTFSFTPSINSSTTGEISIDSSHISISPIDDAISLQNELQKQWDASDPWINQIVQLQLVNKQYQSTQQEIQPTSTINQSINMTEITSMNQSTLLEQQLMNTLINNTVNTMMIDQINKQNEMIFQNELVTAFNNIKQSTNDEEVVKYKCRELLSSIYLQGNTQINQNEIVKKLHEFAFTPISLDDNLMNDDETNENINENEEEMTEEQYNQLLQQLTLQNEQLDNEINKNQNKQQDKQENINQNDTNNFIMIDDCEYPFVPQNPYKEIETISTQLNELESYELHDQILLLEASLQQNKTQSDLWVLLSFKLNYAERDDIALKAINEAKKYLNEMSSEMKQMFVETSLSIYFNTQHYKEIIQYIDKKYSLHSSLALQMKEYIKDPTMILGENDYIQIRSEYLLQQLSNQSSKDSFYDKAMLHLIVGNGEEAAYCLSQYWDVKGEIEWNRIGVCYALSYKHEEAIDCYLQALQFNNNNSRIHLNLGLSYEALEEWRSAIEHYCESLLLSEGNNTWDLLYVALLMCGFDDLASRCKEDQRDNMVISDIYSVLYPQQ